MTKKIKKKSKRRLEFQSRSFDEAVSEGANEMELEAIKKSQDCKHGDKLNLAIDFLSKWDIEDKDIALACRSLCKVFFKIERTTF